METTPDHIIQIMHINAHPKFFIEWIDRLDELYIRLGSWMKKVGLEQDRAEIEKIVAWLIPHLCSEANTDPKSDLESETESRAEWKQILDGLNRFYHDDPAHRSLGLRKGNLERKIELAKKKADYFQPKRGQQRRVIDRGLDMLVWRMEDLEMEASTQRYALLELFKIFGFAPFQEKSTTSAYEVINRIRTDALTHPRTELDFTPSA